MKCLTRQMHSDGKKRRCALLCTAGDLRRSVARDEYEANLQSYRRVCDARCGISLGCFGVRRKVDPRQEKLGSVLHRIVTQKRVEFRWRWVGEERLSTSSYLSTFSRKDCF